MPNAVCRSMQDHSEGRPMKVREHRKHRVKEKSSRKLSSELLALTIGVSFFCSCLYQVFTPTAIEQPITQTNSRKKLSISIYLFHSHKCPRIKSESIICCLTPACQSKEATIRRRVGEKMRDLVANAFGDDKMATHFETVSLSRRTVTRRIFDIQNPPNLTHFPACGELRNDIPECETTIHRYREAIEMLQDQFNDRFQDFHDMRGTIQLFTIQLFTDPISAVVNDQPPELQMELCDLQNTLRNDIPECETTIHRYIEAIEMLQDQFNDRFQDFHDMRGTIQLFTDPFSAVMNDQPPELQMELCDLQGDVFF
ncbi:hypothetical protein F7725_020646 [Dissostichus mawsoni]|uniref:Uncharacterized protein n=1 Tax=Dissostichus mawsoni TaxID=36200 RepID=A0A7J5YH62_DISMA|nr:hypothetical protein F7725_020646 [Dissostichus mawsoni]